MSKTLGNLFLSVGAMKASTTWMFRVLSKHPELHCAVEKELHYFYHRHVDPHILTAAHRNDRVRRKYIRVFRDKKLQKELPESRLRRIVRKSFSKLLPRSRLDLTSLCDQEREWIENYLSDPIDDGWFNRLYPLSESESYACEFSNLSALLPAEVWRDIDGRSNRLRVLYTLRDPVKRLWSQVKFEHEARGQLDRLSRWKPVDYEAYVRKPSFWDHAEYGRHCLALKQGLPKDSVRIQISEDMHADPAAALRAIEHFLSITPFTYPKALLAHQVVRSAPIPMPDFFPELFATDVKRIKGELADLGIHPGHLWN